MLGVFAKVVRGQSVKSRLRTRLTRQDAERFYIASLADTLETVRRVDPAPILFLRGGEDSTAVSDLKTRVESMGFDAGAWSSWTLQTQMGADLGARLEHAFDFMLSGGDGPALMLGSDSPSVSAHMLRRAMDTLRGTKGSEAVDVVLGPTHDGGYWSIGVRRPLEGLLNDVAWSTSRTFDDTMKRCQQAGLRVAVLEAWTDVDHPEDLSTLRKQIAARRAQGDADTARHAERVLAELPELPVSPTAPTPPSPPAKPGR